ncbi:hypothetical protein [Rubrivirga sp. IMCC45206]|uniref:hypothetical protein n=1 Tax=Rubrivirga sp. IMCC45206 TaxID=3391614 RepID=UPI0039902559
MSFVHPLSRRPQQRRLVIAVRGAAGTGKSWFAASLADAGLGRLCFFDTERKARLLAGADGSAFDAIEVEHPDELLPFVDWALGEGRDEQGYGCFALDSWAMYFGRKHRATVQAVRERTGDPTAQPSAEALQADQIVFQEVLRRLCVDSGACVVITDQTAARGKQDREENEMGRVLPMTASGLEYFVDVMLELSLRQDGFDTRRVATVVKSNAPGLPVGLEIDDPVFADVLALLGAGPAPVEVHDLPDVLPMPALSTSSGPTVGDLLTEAEGYGVGRPQVLLAARHYCGVQALDELTEAERTDLLDRMRERYATSGDSAATLDAEASDTEVRVAKRKKAA